MLRAKTACTVQDFEEVMVDRSNQIDCLQNEDERLPWIQLGYILYTISSSLSWTDNIIQITLSVSSVLLD